MRDTRGQGDKGAGEQASREEVTVSFSPLPLRISASFAPCTLTNLQFIF